MSNTCVTCHLDWSDEDIDSEGICRYCWDKHAEDWIGDDDEA